MATTVELPLWLVVLALVLATIAALDRVLMPSARWFLRRRMERLVARLNTKLDRPIEPFKLMRRQDMIARLVHDRQVMQAVLEHAQESGMPESVAFQEARTYAREIVPGFSALVYFGFAMRAARWLSRALYRVRIGKVDAALAKIDRKSTVIFVMNHRSNMDYVLVTWLVANRSALSYAVGEWARIWPLSALIRSMGAYFIRRGSRNTLYRRVLSRYVQMATADLTTQAIFPEGGLSLTGRVGEAKMGLLSYIVAGFDPASHDVLFVPTAIAYDRVLEDRVLVAAGQEGSRKFRASPLAIAWFIARMLWMKLRGVFPGFGTAAVAFGAPVSLRDYMARDAASTEGLGALLMAEVAQSMPILPVPLVAAAALSGPVSQLQLTSKLAEFIEQLKALGAVLKLPPGGAEATVAEGIRVLKARGILQETPEGFAVAPEKAALLRFYAACVVQRLEAREEHQTASLINIQ